MIMTKSEKNLCEQLNKEQLIWLIGQWMETESLISEILVNVSKCGTSPENAIDEIRTTLIGSKAANFPSSYKIDNLKTELDFFMGKISKKECRRRLGFE